MGGPLARAARPSDRLRPHEHDLRHERPHLNASSSQPSRSITPRSALEVGPDAPKLCLVVRLVHERAAGPRVSSGSRSRATSATFTGRRTVGPWASSWSTSACGASPCTTSPVKLYRAPPRPRCAPPLAYLPTVARR